MWKRPSLSRLIDLAMQIEDDEVRSPESLRRRDHRISRELAGRAASGPARVVAWLDRVLPADRSTPGARVATAQRTLTVLLALGGLLVGVGTGSALFYYDGTHPVNVVRVLAVFVGLQSLLIAMTAVLALPEDWRRKLPALAALQDVLALASPGRLQGALRRLVPAERRAALERVLGVARAHQGLYGEVQKWSLLLGSQWFGVAFNVGAIVTCMFLVAFTDLAFGWSTTLDVDERRLHALVRGLSAPWRGWLPDATPTFALVESTQYFRGRRDVAADPATTAPWWRFLLACMLVYGLAPRFAALCAVRWRLSVAIGRAFEHVPGLAALSDRLDSRLVETTAEGPEPEPGGERASIGPAADLLPAAGACQLVLWAGLPLPDDAAAGRLAGALGLAVARVHRAGEGALEVDDRVVREVAESDAGTPVVVLVKAWEPPVLECLDFLRDLRAGIGATRVVAVVPLGLDESGLPGAPEPTHARQWRRALQRLGDPRLSVHAVAGSPS
jgi:hypothetical protein